MNLRNPVRWLVRVLKALLPIALDEIDVDVAPLTRPSVGKAPARPLSPRPPPLDDPCVGSPRAVSSKPPPRKI